MNPQSTILLASPMVFPAAADPWGNANPKPVKAQHGLQRHIAACSSQTQTCWFPEKAAELAACLKRQHARLKH